MQIRLLPLHPPGKYRNAVAVRVVAAAELHFTVRSVVNGHNWVRTVVASAVEHSVAVFRMARAVVVWFNPLAGWFSLSARHAALNSMVM